ncbi:MAG: YjbH domain-containing protein [Pseudomonadota bacterium]
MIRPCLSLPATGLLVGLLAAALLAPLPAHAQQISEPASVPASVPGLGAGFLGLPVRDNRPAQGAFVLERNHPSLGSEAGPGVRAPVNSYGMPGLIDMPAAHPLPDGEIGVTVSNFAGLTRTTLSFQIAPRLTGAFRYNRFGDLNIAGFVDYFDRAFDIHYLIFDESDWRPALAVGLRDFVGTGIEASEYLVASKRFALPPAAGGGRLTVSGGLGWGRLGSAGAIGSPFSDDRPTFTPGDTGGELAFDQWFRGPMAPFAGLEWQPSDRLRVKLEWSSDDYELETAQGVFDRASPINAGVEWQASPSVRLGAYTRYGSEVGVMLHYSTNPRRSPAPFALPGPGPLERRPDRAELPALWTTNWRATPDIEEGLAALLEAELSDDFVQVTGLTLTGPNRAEAATLRIEASGISGAPAFMIGRSLRAMAVTLPPSVETFTIVLEDGGLPLSQVTVRRTDLEALETAPDREEALASVASLTAAPPSLSGEVSVNAPGLYPRSALRLRPYLSTAAFDPDEPLRADIGLALSGRFEPVRGLAFAGQLRLPLRGNLDEARLSTSALEPVRTNGPRYAQAEGVRLRRFTASYDAKLGGDLYGRATAGYFETMFGGVAAELLWKPVSSRLALGAELAYVGQRDFDQRFGFQDYRVLTGHVSAYYDFGNGFLGQVDAGRYLAGDAGATLTLTREFDNGWRVGAFATFTDVSAEDFGEGSFDKGIRVSIPLQSIIGRPSTQRVGRTIRPIQRDGGARVEIEDRLYERVRDGHAQAVFADWSRVWR